MKRVAILIPIFCLLSSFSWYSAEVQAQEEINEPILRKVDNNTFLNGEFLKYKIHYGLINAGFAEMKIDEEPVMINDRPCYHITGKGYSNSFFAAFYRVRDTYESYMDKEALISWWFKRDIVEGGFESFSETKFDHYQNKANYIGRSKEKKEFSVPDNIQDVLSSFYYARTTKQSSELQPGDRLNLRNFIDRKTVNLEAEMVKREVIKVQGKKYKTMKMKLTIEEAGLITDGSKIFVWISDDDNKIPIRIASHLLVGSLKADLIEHKKLRHPFEALIDG